MGGLHCRTRNIGVNFGSFRAINVSAPDIHFVIIIANSLGISVMPFVEASAVTHVMLRKLVVKHGVGEAISPAVDA